MGTAGGAPQGRSARRQELLDAVSRVIERSGPDVSMDVLAAEAGITKPILYRHFGDKRGLLAAHAQRHAQALAEDITATLATRRGPRSRIHATIDAYLAAIEREPQTHWYVTRRSASEAADVHAAFDDIVDRLATAVAQALEEELAAAGASTDAALTWARAVIGMVQLAGDRWLQERAVPRAVLADQLTDLLWLGFRGLGAR